MADLHEGDEEQERDFETTARWKQYAGVFVQGFESWSRAMDAAKTDEIRHTIFRNTCIEAATYVAKGLSKPDACDALLELADDHDIVDQLGAEAVQEIIAEAFKDIQPKTNGKHETPSEEPPPHQDIPHESEQQSTPGPGEIKIKFPYPIVGEEIARRPWLIPGLILRRQLTLLVAPPGIGKSLFTLQISLMCAAPLLHWAGWRPRGRFRVLIVNSEEDEDEMLRRLYATAEAMQIDHGLLREYVSFADKPDDIVIAKADARTKTVTRTPMVERIIATVLYNNIDLIVVDPFAETFVGDENNNSELKWAAVLWREVARRTNAGILLVHHAKKYSGDMAGDMDAARGGGSMVGVARIVCTLFGMTSDEATALKIDPNERTKYLRFDDAKANLTLITKIARWFEKRSHPVPNAGDGEPADEVGVLIPWRAPSAFDEMTDAQANAILDKIDKGVLDEDGQKTGDYFLAGVQGRKPKNWVGDVIQAHLGCTDKDARTIINKWISNKVITTFTAITPSGKGHAIDNNVRVNNANRPGDILEDTTL